MRSRQLTNVGIVGLVILAAAAIDARAADFYQGKQIHLLVSTQGNDAYEAYARIMQQVMPDHIPGHPFMIVQTMAGSSGLLAANYLANTAPRDGSVIAAVEANIPTAPLYFPDNAKFDATDFTWLGSLTSDPFIGYVWGGSQLQTYEQAKAEPFIMGAPSARSFSAFMAQISNTLFGTKFKLVVGYSGSDAVKLAMERGEIDGTFGNAWSDLKAQRPAWITEHKVRVLTQFGLKRHPELPDVPLFVDQAVTPEDKELLLLLQATQEFAKPYLAPPGTPQEQVKILRSAFDATLKDQRFLDAAHALRLDIYAPLDGEALGRLVAQLAHTPPAIVKRARDMLSM